jgi:peptidoglycan-associated lipoprotein
MSDRLIRAGTTMFVLAVVLAAMGCGKTQAVPVVSVSPTSTASAPADSRDGDAAASPASSATAGLASSKNGVPGRVSPADYSPIAALKDVHFEYDKSEVRTQDRVVLDRNAGWMLEHPKHLILIEGHADERGTNEYNLALADKRARAAMVYLVSKGVRAERIAVLSYGEERPLCNDATHACWARNRRASFRVRAE